MDNALQPVSEGLDLRQILGVLGKWRWLIALVTGVSVLTSGFLSFFVLPRIYSGTATLDVSYAAPTQNQGAQQSNPQGLQGVIQSVATLPQNTLETYQWQVTNPVVLDATSKALAALGVSLTPAQLSTTIKTSLVANTNLISVSATDTNPVVAAQIVNTLTAQYLKTVQAQNHAKLTQAAGFLQDQAQSVQRQLATATAALTKAEGGAGSSGSTALKSDQQELATLQGQLTQAQVQLSAAQAGLTALRQQRQAVPPTLTTVVTRAPAASGGASGAQAGGATSTTEPNPTYQGLVQQEAAQQVTVAQDQATVQALRQAVAGLNSGIQALSNKAHDSQAGIQALQTQVDELTQTYQTLEQNLTQAQVADSMSLGGTVVTLAAPAVVPIKPIKPNKKLNLALALVLGLLVSVGLVFLLEQFDNTIKTPDDVQGLTNLPTLAVIPHFTGE